MTQLSDWIELNWTELKHHEILLYKIFQIERSVSEKTEMYKRLIKEIKGDSNKWRNISH